MKHVHELIGIAVLATNGLVAVWGVSAWMRGSPSTIFWYLLRVAQLSVVIAVVDGLIVSATGGKPPDGLHYVYGIAPLVVSLVTEAMRAGVASSEMAGVEDPDSLTRREQVRIARNVVVREMGIMTVGTILIFTLAIRAAQSGGLF